jgi:glyoxylase-like metal-dependent hydrolase (beta-lactamase superfamily II)
VIFKQFYLPCLAHASYTIGDEQTGAAAVVDPQRDTDQYVAFAAEHALQIKHVFLTHLHADFVAGHLELRDRVGATIYLGAAAKAAYPFTPLRDGDILEFGRVRLKVLETPGHTPESISILIYDLAISDVQPHAVLTGDTLFIGDVGRPDLRAALGWSATELGSMLFDSLHTKLLTLPDESLVYPAHGAGSLCGKALSKETVSTLGEQRRSNYALQPMSKDAFIQVVTADQPEAPAYFTYDAVLNSEERPTLDQALAREMNPLLSAVGPGCWAATRSKRWIRSRVQNLSVQKEVGEVRTRLGKFGVRVKLVRNAGERVQLRRNSGAAKDLQQVFATLRRHGHIC